MITIGPGETVNDINIVVPKLEATITIQGVLRYSDGKPVVEARVSCKANSADKSIRGDVSELTDSNGRFSLKILKGLSGELSGEDWVIEGHYKNCPKVDELLAKNGNDNVQIGNNEPEARRSYRATTIQSNIINFEATQNFYNLEPTLPFPRCEKTKE